MYANVTPYIILCNSHLFPPSDFFSGKKRKRTKNNLFSKYCWNLHWYYITDLYLGSVFHWDTVFSKPFKKWKINEKKKTVSKTVKRTDDVSQKCLQQLLNCSQRSFQYCKKEKRKKKLIYIHMLSWVELEHRNPNTFSSEKQGRRKVVESVLDIFCLCPMAQ